MTNEHDTIVKIMKLMGDKIHLILGVHLALLTEALQQNQRSLLHPSRSFYPVDQIHGTNIGLPYAYRFPFNY